MEISNSKLIPAVATFVCAVLILIALFLVWFNDGDLTQTGKEFWDNADDWTKIGASDMVPCIPVVSLGFAVVAAIFAAITLTKVNLPEKVSGIAYIVIGVLILFLSVMYMSESVDVGGECVKFVNNLDVGLWFNLVAGVLLGVNGILQLAGYYGKYDN